MKSTSVTVSKRGYIVLPAPMRKAMQIKPGTRVLINQEKNRLTLEAIPSFTQKLAGLSENTIGKTPEAVNSYIDRERDENSDD